jgi:hypothetical protein
MPINAATPAASSARRLVNRGACWTWASFVAPPAVLFSCDVRGSNYQHWYEKMLQTHITENSVNPHTRPTEFRSLAELRNRLGRLS